MRHRKRTCDCGAERHAASCTPCATLRVHDRRHGTSSPCARWDSMTPCAAPPRARAWDAGVVDDADRGARRRAHAPPLARRAGRAARGVHQPECRACGGGDGGAASQALATACFAVGAGTAAALRRAGIDDVHVPARVDSEGLLAMAALQDIAGHARRPGHRAGRTRSPRAGPARARRDGRCAPMSTTRDSRAPVAARLRRACAPRAAGGLIALSSGEALRTLVDHAPRRPRVEAARRAGRRRQRAPRGRSARARLPATCALAAGARPADLVAPRVMAVNDAASGSIVAHPSRHHPTVIDTDPSPEPPVRRSRAPLAWLVVLLLVLGGAWAWHAWNTRAKHERAAADDATQRLTALEGRIDTLRSEQRAQHNACSRPKRPTACCATNCSASASARRCWKTACRSSPIPIATARRRCAWTKSRCCSAWRSNACSSRRTSTARVARMRSPPACSTASTIPPTSACARRWRRNAARSMRKGVDPVRDASDEARPPSKPNLRACRRPKRSATQATHPGGSASLRAWSTCSRAIACSCTRRATGRAAMEALGIELTLARAALERRDAVALAGRARPRRRMAAAPVAGFTGAARAKRRCCRGCARNGCAIASPVVGTTLAQLRAMRAR